MNSGGFPHALDDPNDYKEAKQKYCDSDYHVNNATN